MDQGWIAVIGVVVGGSLTGIIALLQARMSHNSELARAAAERHHADHSKRRDELVRIYTRYQLAADALENAIRDLPTAGRDSFEAAQNEYDVACQMLILLAPEATVETAMNQRRLFNQLARQGLDGTYRHDDSRSAITAAATPVLHAMRDDLESATESRSIRRHGGR